GGRHAWFGLRSADRDRLRDGRFDGPSGQSRRFLVGARGCRPAAPGGGVHAVPGLGGGVMSALPMRGLTSRRRFSRAIAQVLAVTAAMICVTCAWAHSSANAAGCTNTWTNTAGGSWSTASNWSKGTVPTSSDEACITTNGTYTVTLEP